MHYLLKIRILFIAFILLRINELPACGEPSAAAFYLEADQWHKEGAFDKAVVTLSKAVKLEPDNHHYLAMLSHYERLDGRYAEGLKHAIDAIHINPKVGWYYASAAFNAQENLDFTNALIWAKKTVELGENSVGKLNYDRALGIVQAGQISEKFSQNLTHIRQESGTNLCAPTTIIMAFQRESGFKLDQKDMAKLLASIVYENAAISSGFEPHLLLNILNIKYDSKDFNERLKIIDSLEVEKLALSTIRNEIIPLLRNGAYVIFQVNNNYNGHVVLATCYDEETDQIVVHDSSNYNVCYEKVESLAKRWPIKYPPEIRKIASWISEDRFYLRLNLLTHSNEPKKLEHPPSEAIISLKKDALVNWKTPNFTNLNLDENDFQREFGGHAKWKLLSKYWPKERDPTSVRGLAIWAKIKVAQGDPVVMLYSEDGSRLNLAAITGYRGGLMNPEGEIELTLLDDNKHISKWFSEKDFLLRCSPRTKNGQADGYCYIAYPIVSLNSK